MATVKVELEHSGPLFEAAAGEHVRQAIQKGMSQAALLGQRLVQEQLTPGHGVRTGTFRRSVVGEAGTWHTGTVSSPLVYAGWLETGKRHGRQTRFPGYQMFEKTAKQLEDGRLLPLFEAAIVKVLE